MTEFTQIIEAIRDAVPEARVALDDTEAAALRKLTGELVRARPEAAAEYARFESIANRSLCLPEAQVSGRIEGATVVVTGGTGCIGSALIRELSAWRPARIVSLSRDITTGWARHPGARYRQADITDPDGVRRQIAGIRPDIVFHVAAQRSPALAETEVHRTVSANVLGTRNVLTAAADAGVPQIVCASTGKALRPYSPEVYTASKRAAEWFATTIAADTSTLVSAARFTHVIDNSIVHSRLLRWAQAGAPREKQVIRLHSDDISFYVQSAKESARLLLIAMLGAVPGEFRVHSISDLGWPVSLLDVAVGVLRETRSATPLYLSGYDPGYEEVAFPGLYDPATAGDVSPLLNAFEAAATVPGPCPMTDSFRLTMAPDPAAPKLLGALDEICARTREPGAVRQALDKLAWALLDVTLAAADREALARCANLVRRHEETMSPVHQRVTRAIKSHACCRRQESRN